MRIEEPICDPQKLATARQMMDLGDCHAAAGDIARAKNCYLKAAQAAPGQAQAQLALGMLALRAEDLTAARQHLLLATAMDRKCAEGHAGLAMIYHRQQEYSKAFSKYMQCLELDGDNLAALLGLFQASCQMGTFSRIIHYLELYLRNHPDDGSVLFCLATLYARSGQLDAARQAALRVLQLEPQKEQAMGLLEQIDLRLSVAGQ